jgi:hypothetical protein
MVHEDSSLPTLSSVRMARGDAPVHLIRFQPQASSWVDYLVAFQAGLIFRSFSPPVDDRFDIGPSYRGRREVEKSVNERIRQAGLPLNKERRLGLRDQLLNGLGVQLRSMPMGLRVDQWIIDEYPALQTQQKQCIQAQLKDNLESLSPEVKRLTPDAIFAATVSMSAAFASFWARTWSDVPLTTPFRAIGLLDAGESLLKIWDEISRDPAYDRKLVEEWANQLGIRTWYEFLPGPTTT